MKSFSHYLLPLFGIFIFIASQAQMPNPQNHRIYFDHGTETLDSMYASLQAKVDAIISKRGYRANQWISRSWPG